MEMKEYCKQVEKGDRKGREMKSRWCYAEQGGRERQEEGR